LVNYKVIQFFRFPFVVFKGFFCIIAFFSPYLMKLPFPIGHSQIKNNFFRGPIIFGYLYKTLFSIFLFCLMLCLFNDTFKSSFTVLCYDYVYWFQSFFPKYNVSKPWFKPNSLNVLQFLSLRNIIGSGEQGLWI